MSRRADLLIEIGTEELPPKSLQALSIAFGDNLAKGQKQGFFVKLNRIDNLAKALGDAGLSPTARHDFATPRRLGVLFRDLPLAQPDRDVERRGPALTAAFDADGRPTRAAEGFARSCGVEVQALKALDHHGVGVYMPGYPLPSACAGAARTWSSFAPSTGSC